MEWRLWAPSAEEASRAPTPWKRGPGIDGPCGEQDTQAASMIESRAIRRVAARRARGHMRNWGRAGEPGGG